MPLSERDYDRPGAQPVATPLARWADVPVSHANLRTATGAAICVSWLIFGILLVEDWREFALISGLTLFVMHGCVHLTTLILLKKLRNQGRSDAHKALAAYRNPYRLSNLDLAMAWAGVAAMSGVV